MNENWAGVLKVADATFDAVITALEAAHEDRSVEIVRNMKALNTRIFTAAGPLLDVLTEGL